MSAVTHAIIIVAVACVTTGAIFGLIVSLLASKRYGISKAETRILGEALLDRHIEEIGKNKFSYHWRCTRDPKWLRKYRCAKCQRIRELLKEGLDDE